MNEQQLIHMNGRIYDYNLGRFMSVDPVIQSPANTQSVNPYSYIMNNPLAGTDPTGYVWKTFWDVGNVIYDGGKIAYVAATDDDNMMEESLTDLAVDGASVLIPFLPAGASKAARAGLKRLLMLVKLLRRLIQRHPLKRVKVAQILIAALRQLTVRITLKALIVQVKKQLILEVRVKYPKRINWQKSKAQGKAKVRQELGDANRGEQVTVETLDGDRARVDFVKTKDGQPNLVEVKTGNASISRAASS